LVVVVGAALAALSVVTGVIASVPLVPADLLAVYQREAQELPDGSVSYEQLVAVDAVRFHQDFSRVTPASIAETRRFFEHCETWKDPETGHEEWKCFSRPLRNVMMDLNLNESDQEYVQQMLMAMAHGRRYGDDGSFTFQPKGPYTWPINGYTITSPYGDRFDPETGKPGFHTGVDIAASEGTPVLAVATGTVTEAGLSGGYGEEVLIDHGGFRTRYGHLSVVSVKQGQVVAAGEVIGYSGNTGRSTGPHLHFEWITDGIPVDPLPYFGG
jgi:hypothetical protein